MEKEISLSTAGLLLISNRKLLLAFSRNKKCFYLPGGKVDEHESPANALCREIAEELNAFVDERDLEYYTHISAPAYGEKKGVIMEQDCFFLHTSIEPVASAEIGELKYFSLGEYLLEKCQAPGALMILEQLKADGLID